MSGPIDRRLSVAPMMERTDRHCRYFLRLIAPQALLYSEMITTPAIIHGVRDRLLGFDPAEHPLALQLGGGDPGELAICAEIAEDWGYDEINLNIGCPSSRVKSGRFGACLMADPDLVGRCVTAMAAATRLPVTVKCRTGIDSRNGYDNLRHFVATVAGAGCATVIVHARDAILDGLDPKQNREIPPLQYDQVYRLKDDFPDLEIILNGGITSLATVREAMARLDGVMIGREAYGNPWFLAEIEQQLWGGEEPATSRRAVIDDFARYARRQHQDGVPLHRMTRHIFGLYQHRPGARAWRRHLGQNAHRDDIDADLIADAAALVDQSR